MYFILDAALKRRSSTGLPAFEVGPGERPAGAKAFSMGRAVNAALKRCPTLRGFAARCCQLSNQLGFDGVGHLSGGSFEPSWLFDCSSGSFLREFEKYIREDFARKAGSSPGLAPGSE